MIRENKIIEAIQSIKADAQVSVSGEDINSIVWENGETPIAKADIEARIPEAEQAIADAETQKVTDKASAISKLEALGLTSSEIDSLTK